MATTRGQILLVNAADMVEAKIVEDKTCILALRSLRRFLNATSPGTDGQTIVKNVASALFKRGTHLQIVGNQQADGQLQIAAIRTYYDIEPILRQIKRAHEKDRRIRNAMAPCPSVAALAKVADIINEYAPNLPNIVLGGPDRILWATTTSEVSILEQKAAAHNINWALALRDRLGLAHIGPDSLGQPTPLYLFEAQCAIGAIPGGLVAKRPTTVDGFDNNRFRQRVPNPASVPRGCGQTVDLKDGNYSDGAPEVVTPPIPIGAHLHCRWVGLVDTLAKGSDKDFLIFIRDNRSDKHFTECLSGLK